MRQGSNLEAGEDVPIIYEIDHQAHHSPGLGKLVLRCWIIGLRQPVGAEGHQEHNGPFDEIRRGEANRTTQEGVPADPKRVRDKLDLKKKTKLEEVRAASQVILTMSIPPQGRRCLGFGEGIRRTTSEPRRMAPRGSS